MDIKDQQKTSKKAKSWYFCEISEMQVSWWILVGAGCGI